MFEFIAFIFFMSIGIFVAFWGFMYLSCFLYQREEKILNDPTVSQDVKTAIKRKRYKNNKKQMTSVNKTQIMKMSQVCKLENVFGNYRDSGLDYKKLTLHETYMSYENSNGISHFAISYDDILDAKCDTTENLTAMRFIALGVLAFAFKKKTYYTVIKYKCHITNSEQQLVFRVEDHSNKEEFINTLLLKRNQYLINKQEPIG